MTHNSVPAMLPPRSILFLGRYAALLALLVIARSALAADGNSQSLRQRYDIPALTLDLALARFSEISGIDVLLREPSASQWRSMPVSGDVTPAEALGTLLKGSGLVARFTSARSAVIVPVEQANDPWIASSGRAGEARVLLNLDMIRVTAPRVIGSSRSAGDVLFAQQLATAIRQFVTEQDALEGGRGSSLRIATRITPDGTLHDVRVVVGSRDQALNAHVAALLEGTRLDLVPPQDLRQPLLFDVTGR